MKNIIITLSIIIVVLLSSAAIRPSTKQIVLTYNREDAKNIKKDLNIYFKKGYKVVSGFSYSDIYLAHNVSSSNIVIIILEK